MSTEFQQPVSLPTGIDYQPGSIVSKILHKGKSGNVTLFAFDEGQELSEHTSPFTACIYLVEGQARITVGGTPSVLSAGDFILLPASVPHAVAAVGRFKMVLTLFIAKEAH